MHVGRKALKSVLKRGLAAGDVSVRGSEMSNWPNKRHSTKAAGVCLLVSSPLCFSSINPITNATHRPQKAAHGRGTAVDRVVVDVCSYTTAPLEGEHSVAPRGATRELRLLAMDE